jgi:putative polyketide hydroxylase
VGHDLVDPAGAFAAAYGISNSGASLIRPDGFVAWRAREMADEPERILREVLRHLLRLTA